MFWSFFWARLNPLIVLKKLLNTYAHFITNSIPKTSYEFDNKFRRDLKLGFAIDNEYF